MILRDRNTSTAWHQELEEDSMRDECVYYAQDWRGDVSALLTDTGSMIEWVKYSAYGVPHALPAGDTDSDGAWDAADEERIGDAIGVSYDVRYDADLDGEVADADIVHADSIAGGYQTLGRGVMSSTSVANRVGYAGYRYDPTFKGAGRTIYHVRHRVYDADVGRWTRRDPLSYVDGMSLYEYVRSRPVIRTDFSGLFSGSHSAITLPGGIGLDGTGSLSCSGTFAPIGVPSVFIKVDVQVQVRSGKCVCVGLNGTRCSITWRFTRFCFEITFGWGGKSEPWDQMQAVC